MSAHQDRQRLSPNRRRGPSSWFEVGFWIALGAVLGLWSGVALIVWYTDMLDSLRAPRGSPLEMVHYEQPVI